MGSRQEQRYSNHCSNGRSERADGSFAAGSCRDAIGVTRRGSFTRSVTDVFARGFACIVAFTVGGSCRAHGDTRAIAVTCGVIGTCRLTDTCKITIARYVIDSRGVTLARDNAYACRDAIACGIADCLTIANGFTDTDGRGVTISRSVSRRVAITCRGNIANGVAIACGKRHAVRPVERTNARSVPGAKGGFPGALSR